MSIEWSYAQHGQQHGPVTAAHIREMAAAGTLRAEDLIWNASMTEWVAASRVKGLSFGDAGGHAPADDAAAVHPVPVESTEASTYGVTPDYATPRQALAYASHTGTDVPVTQRTIDLLRQTRPCVLFIAILMFIWAGVMCIGALVFMGMGMTGRGGNSRGLGILAFVYIGIGALMVIPPIYLTRYFSRIGALTRSGRAVDLENALEAQKSYWKFIGIFAIVVFAIYVLIGILAVVVGRF
jgi:hypothetical protein